MKTLFTTLLSLLWLAVPAQKNQLEKTWYNQEKTSKIQVYKGADGKLYGKIVWLKEPLDQHGKPRTDDKNSNPLHKDNPLLGLVILKAFKPTADPDVYEDGTVYDPKNGKTYCGKITYKGSELNLRGFICSFSLLGRSSTWTLAE